MIKIDNTDLANYIMFKLNKEDNNFTIEELGQIDEIIINPININGEYEKINLEEITYFSNLKRILFKNLTISENTITNLSSMNTLESVYFEKCEFENTNLLTGLTIKEIGFINCEMIDYSFVYEMSNLQSLSIVNGVVSISGVNKLKELEYLQLSYSTMMDMEKLNLPLLKELHIDNTNIMDTSNLENLANLQRIGISEDQYEEEKGFYKNLIQKGILVLNQNLLEFNEGRVLNESV